MMPDRIVVSVYIEVTDYDVLHQLARSYSPKELLVKTLNNGAIYYAENGWQSMVYCKELQDHPVLDSIQHYISTGKIPLVISFIDSPPDKLIYN